MKAVRGFAGAAVLALAFGCQVGSADAERDGAFVHQGAGSSSSWFNDEPNAQPSRSSDGFFFKLFRPKKNRSFDGGFFFQPRRHAAPRQAVEVEPPPAIEKISVYQPERLVSLSLTALSESAPSEPLAAAIYGELLSPDSTIKVTAAQKAALVAFYRNNGFKPLWTAHDGITARGKDVLAFLARSGEDGMEPQDYLPPVLGSFADAASLPADPRHLARLDLGLSAAALSYARDASGGRLIPDRLTSYDDITPEPVELNQAVKIIAWTPYPVAYLKRLQPSHPAYAAFKAALKDVRRQLGDNSENSGNDTIAEGKRVKPGQADERIPLVRKELQRLGFLEKRGGGKPTAAMASLAATTTVGSADDTLDPGFAKALKSFQKAAEIKISGNLDAATVSALNNRSLRHDLDRLIYNMERVRWLPKDLGTRHVLVNQAAFELKVMDHGRETWRTRIIVGKPDTQTFAFHDEIEMVVFNPSWGVPQSIIKNEMLPLLRKNPSYLDREGYRVITKSGQIVHSSQVNWWAVGGKVIPYSIQQPPSDDNALGEIKFLFPNKHDIYMHDTPTKPLFSKSVRAYSHGCVRVENPRVFGEMLLGWSPDEIAAKIDSGVSETVKLPRKVPVHLTYFTAWPDSDGKIVFYNDVYGRDQRMERAFSATEVASR